MSYDVLVLGEPLLERHTDAAGRPAAPDAVSGDAFNVASAAALAGARVALLTALGRDEGGDLVLAELRRRGIGTEHVITDHRPTGAYTISPDADGLPEFSYQRAGSAASALEPAHFARWREVVAATPVLLTGGIFAVLTPATAALVREAVVAANGSGRAVCYDVNFRPRLTDAPTALRALKTVAPHCRLIKIASPGDSGPLLGHTAPADVVSAMREFTDAAVVVTDGAGPLTLAAGQTVSRHPAREAPAFVDATGAGDVLLGTLAAGLARGEDVAAALPEAMAAAAISTGHRGGAAHATRAEVAALLGVPPLGVPPPLCSPHGFEGDRCEPHASTEHGERSG